jgi:hypothetical protein
MSGQNFMILVLALSAIWYLSHQAGRLDRLHHRIEVSELALFGQLNRRAGIVAELANASSVDPALSVVWGEAAHDVLAVETDDPLIRIALENELTQVLLATLEDSEEVAEIRSEPHASRLLDELSQVANRIQMGRRFHGDAVRDCLEIRNQTMVGLFRLAGHAPMPHTIDFDDQIPAGLLDSPKP